ncbi:hypothetical protein [Streptomyces sp. NPDC050848]|uniref:hypothetical protein n=1 Tax=Streptomyces sp. NPDC050848 TaxID=3155791 RepID=UPI003404B73A
MKQRLTALLLVFAALFGLSAQPAAADGIVGGGVEVLCNASGGGVYDLFLPDGYDFCDALGDAVQEEWEEEWRAVWDSALGDVIKSSEDVGKWMVQKVLTVALQGPSLDLKATGLFGEDATLAGMMVWLGLVIAAAGMMWQLGKMAVTGQVKHAGRAMAGWVENIVLSTIGVSLFVLLLEAGDAMTKGMVDAVFNDDQAYERVVKVMLPAAIANPIMVLGVVAVLMLVGFIQLITVFLRQSAIPIICLLLPVAGAGRVGGDATRQWAPKLITGGLVIVAYKPILAIIICVGFAEFGKSATLAEWLRGCATLVLGVLAPGPLAKIFAPFGAAVGGGMAASGAGGALGAAADYLGGKMGGDGGGGDSGGPASAVDRAQYIEKVMGKQGGGGSDAPDNPPGGGGGGDAQAQAARNEGAAQIPAQAGPEGVAGTAGAATGTATASGTAGAATTAAGPAGAIAAAGIQVLDGVNDAVQGAAGEMGGGNQQ